MKRETIKVESCVRSSRSAASACHHFIDHPPPERIANGTDIPLRSLFSYLLHLQPTTTMNKTIIVTGASRGIGLECARILLEKFNANVVTLSRSVPDELNELKNKHDARLEVVQGDVSSETDQKVRVG